MQNARTVPEFSNFDKSLNFCYIFSIAQLRSPFAILHTLPISLLANVVVLNAPHLLSPSFCRNRMSTFRSYQLVSVAKAPIFNNYQNIVVIQRSSTLPHFLCCPLQYCSISKHDTPRLATAATISITVLFTEINSSVKSKFNLSTPSAPTLARFMFSIRPSLPTPSLSQPT